MSGDEPDRMSRRQFVGGLGLAGAAGVVGMRPDTAPAAEPPPESTRIRLPHTVSVCAAPQIVAGELLKAEGFDDVRTTRPAAGAPVVNVTTQVASGAADVGITFSGPTILQIDAGDPVVVLAGIHPGCFELFGTERVRTLNDLKGKKIAVTSLGSSPHVFLSAMLAHVGLDPRRDVEWVIRSRDESVEMLRRGQVDAYMGFPPEPQELRARKIGHVLLNSATDRPWSQYFCCMLAANREFVRTHPVGVKRALRAFLKATDVCAAEPDRVARSVVENGWTDREDHVRQTLRELPYARWREYNPEDTIRFYALRLREAGMIKGSPRQIIARGTDWWFLNELKRELKG